MSIRIVALAGSLRRASYNRAVLEALCQLAPEPAVLDIFDGLGALPLFNPDQEENLPPAVTALKTALARADGLILASPEYAHGISGVMKNALDWLVSGEAFVNLPVALINTSPRASHAQAALREVVTTMSGIIVEEACVAVPLLGSGLDAGGIVADPGMSTLLREGLFRFCRAIEAARGG